MDEKEIKPLPCPFCGWGKIRVIEEKWPKGFFKVCRYTYAWCKPCGTKGPWAFNIEENGKIIYEKAIKRWNERH